MATKKFYFFWPTFPISLPLLVGYGLRGVVYALFVFLLLTFLDALLAIQYLYHISLGFIPVLIIFSFLFWGLLYVFFPSVLFRKTRGWQKKFGDIFVVDPEILHDLAKNKLYPRGALSEEKRAKLLAFYKKRLLILPRELWWKEIVGLFTKWILGLCVLLSFLLVLSAINPKRLWEKEAALLGFTQFSLLPPAGKYLKGNSFDIKLGMLAQPCSLLGFEGEPGNTQNLEILPDKVRLLSLEHTVKLRLHVLCGWERRISPWLVYEPLLPGIFEKIILDVIPPSSLGQVKPYSTQSHLLYLHYGSYIKARVYYKGEGEVFCGQKKLKHSKGYGEIRMQYPQETSSSFSFRIKDSKTGIYFDSANYYIEEIPDYAPKVEIILRNPGEGYTLPEKGLVYLAFYARDDYGYRFFKGYLQNEKGGLFVFPVNAEVVPSSGFYEARGNFSVDLRNYPGRVFKIGVVARDNSMIFSRFFLEPPQAGQLGFSNIVEIRLAENEKERQELEENEISQLSHDLESLYQGYLESEREFDQLFQRLRQKEKGQKVEKDMERWLEQRRELQSQVRESLAKTTQTQSLSPEERQRRQKLSDELKAILEEKIAEREAELHKLMENFPQDFEVSEALYQKMSRLDYLQSLENAIEHLKKIQELRELQGLEKKLLKEIRFTENLMKSLVSEKKENIVEESEKQRERLEEMQQKVSAKVREKGSIYMEDLKKNQLELAHASNSNEQMSRLGERRKILEAWHQDLKDLRRLQERQAYEKAGEVFRQAALKVNNIAQVWQEKTSPLQQKKTLVRQEAMNMGFWAAELLASLRYEKNWLKQKLAQSGFFPPAVEKLLLETEHVFEEIPRLVAQEYPYLLQEKISYLRWKLNLLSKELLRQMSSMKMQIMSLKAAGQGEELSQAEEAQKEISAQVRQLAESKSAQEQSLSALEKAYLQELAERQQAIAQALRQLAQQRLSTTWSEEDLRILEQQLQEEAQKLTLVQEISELRRLAQNLEEVKDKFLRLRRALKQREDRESEREAVPAREYYLSPGVAKTPERQKPREFLPPHEIPGGELGRFYLRYLYNLREKFK
ncbi:MAG: hypothetical protein NZM25_10920 [Leptospiraceae bacterium]|nr:hypothetical protein [Leptospiraceae bacterium]MDW8305941.1 hypothetical protein [Leptospiraceae bacterium]